MAGRVVIDIFRVDVCTASQKSLHNAQVSTNTSDMQRCSKIARSCINYVLKLPEYFNQVNMTLVRCHMQGSPSIRIALVNKRSCKRRLLFLQNLETFHMISFLGRHPDLAEQFPLALLFKGLVLHLIEF